MIAVRPVKIRSLATHLGAGQKRLVHMGGATARGPHPRGSGLDVSPTLNLRRRRGDRISEGASEAGAISRCKSGPGKVYNPPGSECCVATGDRGCEACTAIAWGVGLSRERSDIAGAECFYSPEGNMCGTATRRPYPPYGLGTTQRHRNRSSGICP